MSFSNDLYAMALPTGHKKTNTNPLPNEEYTVGWIAALPHEAVAAKAALDECHGRKPLTQSSVDQNAYILGKIRDHNVVIASLPGGTIGPTAATTTAMHMLASFPSIRIGLMVGIGAGIPKIKKDPSTNQYRDYRDIRLGDVVVSQPGGQHGGVKQYDLGKALTGGAFQPTGSLNRPPRALLNATGVLCQLHMEGESELATILEQMLEKLSRAKPSFAFPGAELDRLFDASYAHPQDEHTCDDCDAHREISRSARSDNYPCVHYGVIASGGRVIKDPVERDRLGTDCICFEMEAAGLMNDFPCLVIRGVCDYADSHKNDGWQRYAAITAAACAKEILHHMTVVEVRNERLAREVSSAVTEAIRELFGENPHSYSMEILSRVQALGQERTSRESQVFLDWITPIDYANQQNDFIRRRQPGTGQWFLDSDEFRVWSIENKKTLVCPGIPGAGKTIISAIVVEYLQSLFRDDRDIGIAYIYCSFQQQDKQHVEDLIANILKQIAQRRPSLLHIMQDLYEKHKRDRTRPSLEELLQTIHVIAKSCSRLFVVIDALDECLTSDGDETHSASRTSFVKEILALQTKCGLNILFTSRPYQGITDEFQNATFLEIHAKNEDVRMYLEGHIEVLPKFVQKEENLCRKIILKISDAVDGMFLLAHIYLESLRHKISPGSVEETLDSWQNQGKTPREERINKAYDEAMTRIKSQPTESKALAESVLSWIAHARRPLEQKELQNALAVRAGDSEFNEAFVPQVDMTTVCAGLVTMDEKGGIVRLVHYTAQQYFDQGQVFPLADLEIATTCLTYLQFDAFETGICPEESELHERLESYPLYDYAARNWGYHAHEGLNPAGFVLGSSEAKAKTELLNESIIMFLESTPKAEASSQTILNDERHSAYNTDRDYREHIRHTLSALHLAAYFGLDGAIRELLSKDLDTDPPDYFQRTPLWWAVKNGHESAVKVLLKKGASVETMDTRFGRTPLWWALANGYNMIQDLLSAVKDINLDPKDYGGQTALSFVAEEGDGTVVQLLLKRTGVDPNSKDKYGKSPLSYAAANGYEEVVRLLLSRTDVDLNLKDKYGKSPLSHAVVEGHETVAKLLLANEGVDADSRDTYDRTPLSYAAQEGLQDIIRLLIQRKDVKPDSKDDASLTPLLYAADKGQEAAVELLVTLNGVNPNTQSRYGRTPLSYAAAKGHVMVLKLLLERRNVCVNQGDNFGQTPLWYAVAGGQESAVELLLTYDGVDPDSKDNHSMTPLLCAARNGYDKVVRLLLNNAHVSVESRDENGRTSLWWAVENNHEPVMRSLLERQGLNLDLQDGTGRTFLCHAAANGYEEVVRLLMSRTDVDLNLKDKYGKSPLSYGAVKGHEAVVKLLLAREGVDPNSKDKYGKSPLSHAVVEGHETVVKLLLANEGVDADSRDTYGKTPLSYAAQEGHETIARLLLEKESVNPSSEDNLRYSPLRWAVDSGQVAMVELLLAQQSVRFKSKASIRDEIFSWAMKHGHENVLRLLIADDVVDQGLLDVNGQTLLSRVAEKGYSTVAICLLAKDGINPDPKDNSGQTPLLEASKNGHATVVKQLLATKKVDANQKDDRGRTSLSYAAGNGHVTVVEKLLATGNVDANQKSNQGRTPLSFAAENGCDKVLQILLSQQSVEPDLKDNCGKAPLSYAAEKGHRAAVELLLAQGGVNPDSRDDCNRTPLALAARRGELAVMELLVRRSTDLDQPILDALDAGQREAEYLLISLS